ncbi:hypothetical protein HHK36_021035 [Tetracentron sinense]|uniref:Uncharacterized protein n=1 Tax=Tetracentron sinense TaxID=13715 RepID=A0A834YUD4_TETSI|nr:hypothetical protein HHK36_021035 [Tetracentron sinense]
MDFFKVKKFRNANKPNPVKGSEDKPVPPLKELKNESSDDLTKSSKADSATEIEDDDDDFIFCEVKQRLKELKRNSFLVLIPEEETYPEEEGEMSSSEWRDSEVEDHHSWCGFDTVYDKYYERMLFFDKMISQLLHEAGIYFFLIFTHLDCFTQLTHGNSKFYYITAFQIPSNPSPRSASKKLVSTLGCFSLKKPEEPEDASQHLQQEEDAYQDFEIAYVGQICLTWEALHCQYTQLSQIISSQPENPICYSHAAQQFQQFQVLLQRFIENEPFEQGVRVEIYARTRNALPKLLQVPNIQGSDPKEKEEEESGLPVLASDLIRLIEGSILAFHLFLKMDKKKSINLSGHQNHTYSSLQQIQSSLQKVCLFLYF